MCQLTNNKMHYTYTIHEAIIFCICINWGMKNDKSDAHQADNTLIVDYNRLGLRKWSSIFNWVSALALNFQETVIPFFIPQSLWFLVVNHFGAL